MGLEELADFPVGEHALQDATVVGVWESNQFTGKPPVELCFAWPSSSQGRIGFRGDPVVFAAKGAVGLQVAVLE